MAGHSLTIYISQICPLFYTIHIRPHNLQFRPLIDLFCIKVPVSSRTGKTEPHHTSIASHRTSKTDQCRHETTKSEQPKSVPVPVQIRNQIHTNKQAIRYNQNNPE